MTPRMRYATEGALLALAVPALVMSVPSLIEHKPISIRDWPVGSGGGAFFALVCLLVPGAVPAVVAFVTMAQLFFLLEAFHLSPPPINGVGLAVLGGIALAGFNGLIVISTWSAVREKRSLRASLWMGAWLLCSASMYFYMKLAETRSD